MDFEENTEYKPNDNQETEPAEEASETPEETVTETTLPEEDVSEKESPEENLSSEEPCYTYKASDGPDDEPEKTKPEENKKEPKEKKKHRLLPLFAALLAVLLVACCGMAGYFGARYVLNEAARNNSAIDPTSPLVLYRSPEIEGDQTGYMTSTEVVSAVAQTVVEITTEETILSSYYSYVQTGAGSGVIISKDGYIVTCNHLVESSSGSGYVNTITVTLTSGKSYTAKIIGADSETDLALIKIDPETELTPAVFPAEGSEVTVGETVLAIGNPLGNLGGTVSQGIVSALSRTITVENQTMTLLQTDVAINPGNSGGGLFNLKGELIGIVNAKNSNSGIEGIGFAIPVSTALPVLSQLFEYGYVRGKPFVGFVLRDVTDVSTAYYLYRRRSTGVFIDSVLEGYNSDVFRVGDRIVAVNGIEVSTTAEVKAEIAKAAVGDKIEFTLSRMNGKETSVITVTAEVFEKKPSTASAGNNP
ncbi:MAG: trypsin-like peptidase domain-containing protein [Clostridia bacterium]|nr:trypsin-like peptidase domain-containing protein [Clostridia bacterium]